MADLGHLEQVLWGCRAALQHVPAAAGGCCAASAASPVVGRHLLLCGSLPHKRRSLAVAHRAPSSPSSALLYQPAPPTALLHVPHLSLHLAYHDCHHGMQCMSENTDCSSVPLLCKKMSRPSAGHAGSCISLLCILARSRASSAHSGEGSGRLAAGPRCVAANGNAKQPAGAPSCYQIFPRPARAAALRPFGHFHDAGKFPPLNCWLGAANITNCHPEIICITA